MIYLVTAGIAWVVAQSLKHMARLIGRNRRIFQGNSRKYIMLSGGMPSAHSATIVAFTTIVGLIDGVDNPLFALSFLISAIIMYDATMVRLSSGQQGDLLNRLLKEKKSKLEPVRVAHGHTLVEVLVGAMIGIVVAVVVFSTTK